jgi:hypothetical protein
VQNTAIRHAGQPIAEHRRSHAKNRSIHTGRCASRTTIEHANCEKFASLERIERPVIQVIDNSSPNTSPGPKGGAGLSIGLPQNSGSQRRPARLTGPPRFVGVPGRTASRAAARTTGRGLSTTPGRATQLGG